MPSRLSFIVAIALALGLTCELAAAPALDFQFYKAKVEPIFLQKRPGHTRCYVCHAERTFRMPNPFYLIPSKP